MGAHVRWLQGFFTPRSFVRPAKNAGVNNDGMGVRCAPCHSKGFFTAGGWKAPPFALRGVQTGRLCGARPPSISAVTT